MPAAAMLKKCRSNLKFAMQPQNEHNTSPSLAESATTTPAVMNSTHRTHFYRGTTFTEMKYFCINQAKHATRQSMQTHLMLYISFMMTSLTCCGVLLRVSPLMSVGTMLIFWVGTAMKLGLPFTRPWSTSCNTIREEQNIHT
jgi:hypothetical protein